MTYYLEHGLLSSSKSASRGLVKNSNGNTSGWTWKNAKYKSKEVVNGKTRYVYADKTTSDTTNKDQRDGIKRTMAVKQAQVNDANERGRKQTEYVKNKYNPYDYATPRKKESLLKAAAQKAQKDGRKLTTVENVDKLRAKFSDIRGSHGYSHESRSSEQVKKDTLFDLEKYVKNISYDPQIEKTFNSLVKRVAAKSAEALKFGNNTIFEVDKLIRNASKAQDDGKKLTGKIRNSNYNESLASKERLFRNALREQSKGAKLTEKLKK